MDVWIGVRVLLGWVILLIWPKPMHQWTKSISEWEKISLFIMSLSEPLTIWI